MCGLEKIDLTRLCGKRLVGSRRFSVMNMGASHFRLRLLLESYNLDASRAPLSIAKRWRILTAAIRCSTSFVRTSANLLGYHLLQCKVCPFPIYRILGSAQLYQGLLRRLRIHKFAERAPAGCVHKSIGYRTSYRTTRRLLKLASTSTTASSCRATSAALLRRADCSRACHSFGYYESPHSFDIPFYL